MRRGIFVDKYLENYGGWKVRVVTVSVHSSGVLKDYPRRCTSVLLLYYVVLASMNEIDPRKGRRFCKYSYTAAECGIDSVV